MLNYVRISFNYSDPELRPTAAELKGNDFVVIEPFLFDFAAFVTKASAERAEKAKIKDELSSNESGSDSDGDVSYSYSDEDSSISDESES